MYAMATIALLHCICNLSILRITNSFRTTLTMPPHRIIQHKKKPKFDAHHMKKMSSSDYYDDAINHRTVTILQRSSNHIVALKPPSVVCHHSGWTGSRSRSKRGEEPEVPMLQRVRDAIHDIDKNDTSTPPPPIRKVNLIHRLDRGKSSAFFSLLQLIVTSLSLGTIYRTHLDDIYLMTYRCIRRIIIDICITRRRR